MQQANSNQSELWQQILTSSNAMSELVQRSDWDNLNLEIENRQALLDEFFAQPLVFDQSLSLESLQQDIHTIQLQNELILKSCKENRDQLAESLRKINIGKDLKKAYQTLS